jgi:hypothetical protein
MQEIRFLDKLVDELTKGRAMSTILRTGWRDHETGFVAASRW